MKKMILTLVFVMSFAGGKVFATREENVCREAIETFKREFPKAEFANWKEIEGNDVYAVWFVYNNQSLVAFFDAQGALLASARLVAKENLPYKVSHAIRKMYPDQEILKIEELIMDGTLSYLFTIEQDETEVGLRVFHDGSVEMVKEEKK